MRKYPRKWNRFVALLAGLFFTLVGASVAATHLSPAAAKLWQEWLQIPVDYLLDLHQRTMIAQTTFSWLQVAAFAVLTLLAIACLVTLLKQGGGRTSAAMSFAATEDANEDRGTTTISTNFMKQYIQDRLEAEISISAVKVSTWNVRKHTGLLLNVRVAAGSSPAQVYRAVDNLTADLDTLVGQVVPIMVRLSPGSAISQSFQTAPRVL